MEFSKHPLDTQSFVLDALNPQDTKIVYRKNTTFKDGWFCSEEAEEYKPMVPAYAGEKLPFVDKLSTYIYCQKNNPGVSS